MYQLQEESRMLYEMQRWLAPMHLLYLSSHSGNGIPHHFPLKTSIRSREECESLGIRRDIIPHGSYLINLGNPDEEKRQKSFNCFLDDLQRCEQLGLELYNFHPGSTVGQATKEESIALIAECINNAHKVTKYITIVTENMAGTGNVIGSQFSELKGIIDRVEDKTRVGVCLDTCASQPFVLDLPDCWNLGHAFAAVRASFTALQTFYRHFRDTISQQKVDGMQRSPLSTPKSGCCISRGCI
jgi:apurinic endonuclease APN1